MKRSEVVDTVNSFKGEEGHRSIVDIYNSIDPIPRGYKLQMSDAWCAATVSAVLHQLEYDDLAECSCPKMIDLARKKGIWIEDDSYTPKPGDIIMYNWKDDGVGDNLGVANHTGIVIKVANGNITVREGNKNSTIGNRIIDVDGKYIRGYITPPYEEAVSEVKEEPQDKNPAISPTKNTEAKEKQEKGIGEYVPGHTYTVVVTALNVRKGAGVDKNLVGYTGLTVDGKKHAWKTGALKGNTRVTCLETKIVENDIWMHIPSGWICAEHNGIRYVK